MKETEGLPLADDELIHIESFVKQYCENGEPVCVFVSGGLDSEVVARICTSALGMKRIRLVLALQDGMEEKYIHNARCLAQELKVPLDEIDMRGINVELIKILEGGNPNLFHADSLLDPNRMKCSLRTTLMSCYQDKGFLIAGSTNRTEAELGFYMTFGDNIAHFKPIQHLYKTQVVQMAKQLGCRSEMINQPPSAGFWEGQEDLLDIAYWMINRAPIMGSGRTFDDADDKKAIAIRSVLTQEKIDLVLYGISKGASVASIANRVDLSEDHIEAIQSIVDFSKKWKRKPILRFIDR